MTKLFTPKSLFIIFAAIVAVTGCTKYNGDFEPKSIEARYYSGEKARNYFSLLCKISKSTPGFFPTQAARAYGYVGLATYESVVNGIRGAQSLAGQVNGLSPADMPKADANLEYNWNIASNA